MKRIILLLGLLLPIIALGQDSNSEQHDGSKKVKEKEAVYKNVDKPAKFKGDLNAYLSKNIVYPVVARSLNVQGVVAINFFVDEQGKVGGAEVKKGIGSGCDEEALRVVSAMPRFEPGMQEGKNVKMYYNLNINFHLEDKQQNANNDSMAKSPNDSIKAIDSVADKDFTGTPPKFRGNINTYLSRNINYPELARLMNVEGVVTISFVVDEDGNVKNAKVVKGIGLRCDEEALRVVRSMPKFKPAIQNGKKINFFYILNINFKLQDQHVAPFDDHKLKFPDENFH